MKNQNLNNVRDLYKTWSDIQLLNAASLYKHEYEPDAMEIILEEINSRGLSYSDSGPNLKSILSQYFPKMVADLLIDRIMTLLFTSQLAKKDFQLNYTFLLMT